MLAIVGFEAVGKAHRSADALLARARARFIELSMADFSAVHVEVLGAESAYGDQSRALAAREVILRLVVEHREAKALDIFARELGSVGLSFAQGTTGLIGGRPKPTPVVRLYTFLIDKSRLAAPSVTVGSDMHFVVPISFAGEFTPRAYASSDEPEATLPVDTVEAPLRAVAHARSGDKGNSSNIAIFCRKPEYLDHLRCILTPARIAAHFNGSVGGPVVRYEAPGLHAFNFVLDDALGGGGMASLRLDAQGKAYGQRALEMLVSVPREWLTSWTAGTASWPIAP
jgi:hypothetical protein